MRRIVTTMGAATIAGIGLTASSAATAPRSPLLPSALLPLSDHDSYSTNETGCQFAFTQGNDTYLFMIGHSVIIRTAPGRAGLNACTISDAQFSAFGDGPGTVSCGGRTLGVRRTGRVTSHEEADSADGPAALTMTQAGHTRTVRGAWGSAC